MKNLYNAQYQKGLKERNDAAQTFIDDLNPIQTAVKAEYGKSFFSKIKLIVISLRALTFQNSINCKLNTRSDPSTAM